MAESRVGHSWLRARATQITANASSGLAVPPAALLELENPTITPHVAGISPEAIQASVQRFIDNATRHFSGAPLLTPVN